jgi:hypothetical protein
MNNSIYYWRVNASNAGLISAWSNEWSFMVGLTSVSPKLNQISMPPIGINNSVLLYSLSQQSEVEIRMYDILGKNIIILNRREPAGSYALSLKNRNLPAGLYFLQFKAGMIEKRMKVVLTGG